MQARSALLTLVALLMVGGAAQTELARVPQAVFAPAYDTVTQSNLRQLGVAMQSYALVEGDLGRVTVDDLAEWGWVPADTTAMTIWVQGQYFHAVARDVRPGSGSFELVGNDEGVRVRTLVGAASVPAAPGVTVLAGLPPRSAAPQRGA